MSYSGIILAGPWVDTLGVVVALALFLFLILEFPIPIGRGKRVKWCGTGMHFHVYSTNGDEP